MRSPGKLKFGVIIMVLIALFVLVNFTGFSKNIRGFFYSFSAPIQKNMWSFGANVSNFFSSLWGGNSLKVQNEKLRQENDGLLLEIASLKHLQSENQALRDASGIGLDKEFRLTLLEVVGKDVNNDVIMVGGGSKDGLSAGMPVITAQKILVGKIKEVFDNYAKVELITNPGISFGAKISGSGVLGEVKGSGRSKMILDRILQDQQVNRGEAVLSTSLGGIFPDGLLVGNIENVAKSGTESFQKANISPAFEINNLYQVFIIINF